MAEEVSDKVDVAIRSFISSVAFVVLIVGAEIMAEKSADRVPLGATLALMSLPLYLSAVIWRYLKGHLALKAKTTLGEIALDARWWLVLLAVLIGLIAWWPFSTAELTILVPLAAAGLFATLAIVIIGLARSGLESATITAPRVIVPAPSLPTVQPDGQTRLEIAHLLDFAVSEAIFWMFDSLLELSESPEITDGFKEGLDTEQAHKSREFFVGYVRQQLGPGFRQSDYVNLMYSAQGEAEGELEQAPRDQRPTELDSLVLRKYRFSERQFGRAVRFIHSQPRELKQKLVQARYSLVERISARENSGRG